MEESEKTRGFVTIATGKEMYYRMAQRLLWSYRMFAKQPMKFALVCDRENKYTEEFDEVIIIDNPARSYMDKLRLYEVVPFDETIYIEADCLIYDDINRWWGIFENGSDFAPFGCIWNDLTVAKGWYIPSGMKEFESDIEYVISMNGGVYFMRKTQTCERVFEVAKYCTEHYGDYAFRVFMEPADEPVFALGMAVNKCRPADYDEMLIAPNSRFLDADISKGRARFTRGGKTLDYRIIHWGSYNTELARYRYEAERLERAVKGKTDGIIYKLFYEKGLRYPFLCIGNAAAFARRVKRKLCKMIRSARR